MNRCYDKTKKQAQTTWKLRESFTQEVAAELNPEQ